ncbi:MAG: RNase adapter RapZ [Firmicutes bacterium]|nr:RNase adapter RapZ [Bacillota bacterium]
MIMELKIVTGMSGAGKSSMMQVLEDMGYYCVDNLPPDLFLKFVELILQVKTGLAKVALMADVRGGRFFMDAYDALEELSHKGISYEIIFLEASDDILVRRFKETRRRHPLAYNGSVLDGIREERKRLQNIRGKADIVIDTTNMRVQDFKEKVSEMLAGSQGEGLMVSVESFGFKYGLPIDADLVMDVRFLPNPYYVAELKPQTGQDEPVRQFVLEQPEAQDFLGKYSELLLSLLPQYVREGKRHLVIAIGCTGGQHRSVAVAEELAARLAAAGTRVMVTHRDMVRNTRGV